MCEPEPAGVLGGMADAAGTVAGAVWAIAKAARWPVLYVLLAGALWFYKWWLIGFTVPLGAAGALIMWRMHQHMIVAASPEMRARLAARGVRGAIPATVAARPALPRAMRRSLHLPRRRPALPPATPRTITGVVISAERARVTR